MQDTGLLDNSLRVGLGRLPLPLSLLRQQTPHPHPFPIHPMQHDPSGDACSLRVASPMPVSSWLDENIAYKNHSYRRRHTFGKTRPLPPLLLTRSTSTPSMPSPAETVLIGMHLQQVFASVTSLLG